jgi:heavy metal sensor kinase
MLYFLALLGLGLGAVSLLAYQTMRETMVAKRDATRHRIEQEFKDSCDKERARLEYALLSQARTMAGLVEFQRDERAFRLIWTVWDMYRTGYPDLTPLSLLTAGVGPNAHLAIPGSLVFAGAKSWFGDPKRFQAMRIKFDEADLAIHLDTQIAQYRQANDNWAETYRSPSLEDHILPFDPSVFQSDQPIDWRHDVLSPGPGRDVLRVILKVARPGRWSRSGIPPGPPPNRMRSVIPLSPMPPLAPGGLFIQCACDKSLLDNAVAEFQARRDEELARVDEQTEESLASSRRNLLLIGLATFIATVFGGFVLVRHGLSPLRKLSVAVSRVSAKDFRLPFEDRRLPSELQPIVSRLTETLDQLKRAFTREKQAAADISHELRTPLAALLTTIDVTLRKARSPEEYREVLEECRASGQQMNHLVERLLALARLDAGVDLLRPQRVDASQLAEECAALVRPLAEARGLELRVHRNGPAPLFADPAKLREVVTNLLHNAIQYNRPRGSIDLTVARQNGSLKVEVVDTGIGMNAEARQHIFERFFRADPARSQDGLHAGLGLAIVKGYVDLMGGSIAVESAEGQGSTFRVELPVN